MSFHIYAPYDNKCINLISHLKKHIKVKILFKYVFSRYGKILSFFDHLMRHLVIKLERNFVPNLPKHANCENRNIHTIQIFLSGYDCMKKLYASIESFE